MFFLSFSVRIGGEGYQQFSTFDMHVLAAAGLYEFHFKFKE